MAINIGGVSVHFPYKPYPSQLSMMNRTIQSIEKCQNCLLESPTGSGKSLALLCASLAWVEKQKELKNTEDNTIDFEDCCLSCSSSLEDNKNDYCESACQTDFPLNKIPCSKCDCHVLQKYSFMNKQTAKIPKIFFGTRTHKQISQLVRELKKTKYKDVNMTILSSRSHSCINQNALHSNNLTEACQEMIKHSDCEFYLRRKKTENHAKLKNFGLRNAWDIEDLVEALTKVGSCPYYSARDLIPESQIVFCPYNYLLDPIFREAVNLNLSNSILILDEAHNIEDASREAASFTISDDQLNLALKDMCELISAQVNLEHTMPLKSMVESLLRLIELTKSRLMREGNEDLSQVWTGVEIVGMLQQMNLGPETFKIMQKHFACLCEEENSEHNANENKGMQQMNMKSTSKILFESLFTVLDFIYKENYKFRDDYRVAVIQSKTMQRRLDSNTGDNLGVWLSHARQKNAPTVSLNFWCLNSAVIFEELGRITRNIVLTSGTLSPLVSFQSELGVLFPLRLEAQHVIPDNQIMVGSVGRGPSGSEICCTYQNTETFLFQDDLGNLIQRASRIVPHGVLCFLPSYSMMDKLINRWQFTGLLDDMKSVKHVMIEPRSSSQYDAWLKEFNSHIRYSERKLPGENGVLLFAVCRGKVSEGMDFADNHARLVLTVGIPFPNFKDAQVQLKRSYNDSKRAAGRQGASNNKDDTLSQSNLLAGSEWYEVQAYRALNQALGRCIRHRDDWGAIIMVDVRFGNNPGKYMSGLSKWLRHRVNHYSNCDRMLDSLSTFVKERVEADATIIRISQSIEYEDEEEENYNFKASFMKFKHEKNEEKFEIVRRKKKQRLDCDKQDHSDTRSYLHESDCNTPPMEFTVAESPDKFTPLKNDNVIDISSSMDQSVEIVESLPPAHKSVVVDLCLDENSIENIEEKSAEYNSQIIQDGEDDLFETASYLPYNKTIAYKRKSATSNRKPQRTRSRRKKSLFD